MHLLATVRPKLGAHFVCAICGAASTLAWLGLAKNQTEHVLNDPFQFGLIIPVYDISSMLLKLSLVVVT